MGRLGLLFGLFVACEVKVHDLGEDESAVESGGSVGKGGATSLPASSGGSGGSGEGGSRSVPTEGMGPCDILNDAGNPCVAAHSTVRLLTSTYSGPLYQLCRGSAVAGPNSCKGTSLDIGVKDGYADSAAHEAFCAGDVCTISKVYDQSGWQNDLEPSPPGGAKPTPGRPANASDLELTINGHGVYGMLFKPGAGYRAGCSGCNTKQGNGIAKGDEPETMYMVTSSKDLINGCCFDYGNAETTSYDDGNGTMEAVYVGMGVVWGSGVGGGPWVMADLENGLYPGWENGSWSNISTATPLKYDYVTALIVGDTADKNGGKGRFAVYGGDATAGTLKTMYDGIRPFKPGYVPMQKQGSIILSTGGDNSDGDGGRFYEGVMANGAATKATIDAVQVNIVAAGYGR